MTLFSVAEAEKHFGPFGQVTQWAEWFAWRPVKTYDDRWVWLRKVKRARIRGWVTEDSVWQHVGYWWVYHA